MKIRRQLFCLGLIIKVISNIATLVRIDESDERLGFSPNCRKKVSPTGSYVGYYGTTL